MTTSPTPDAAKVTPLTAEEIESAGEASHNAYEETLRALADELDPPGRSKA